MKATQKKLEEAEAIIKKDHEEAMKEKEDAQKKANDKANEILRGMKSGQFDIDSYTK